MSLEKDLIEKLKMGDDTVFRLLFHSNYSKLCTYARDFLHKHEIAEEIVQDVFIKLWNSRNELNIRVSLRAYLYKMVQNQSLNYLRDNASSKKIKEENLEDFERFSEIKYLEETEYSVIDKMLSDEVENDLNIALAQLPVQCREIFILCRYEGLSYSEIAKKNNVSLSTVKTQMGRAMDKLYHVMKKHL